MKTLLPLAVLVFVSCVSYAQRDTVIVRPKQSVRVFFDADNPGQWLAHCHNAFHAERGMMALFSYIK